MCFNGIIWVAVILLSDVASASGGIQRLYFCYKLATLREVMFNENICYYLFNVNSQSVQETMTNTSYIQVKDIQQQKGIALLLPVHT